MEQLAHRELHLQILLFLRREHRFIPPQQPPWPCNPITSSDCPPQSFSWRPSSHDQKEGLPSIRGLYPTIFPALLVADRLLHLQSKLCIPCYDGVEFPPVLCEPTSRLGCVHDLGSSESPPSLRGSGSDCKWWTVVNMCTVLGSQLVLHLCKTDSPFAHSLGNKFQDSIPAFNVCTLLLWLGRTEESLSIESCRYDNKLFACTVLNYTKSTSPDNWRWFFT